MIGETLGSYRVVRKLGQGGMGVVFVAEHTLIGKQAAIKVLLPELSASPDIVNRFFNEARAATLIKHPGIVDIYDFGHHASGSAYIVMEFLDGESLAERLRREPLSEALAIEIVRQVAAALSAAHEKGIVHRDLKPDNVFLVPDATITCGVRVKVLDFGIAKLAGDSGGMKTHTGAVMGTPYYMAPEQCRGVAIDARADIYSLGCMVYEMFAGRPPFLGEGPGDVLAAHIYEQPVPIETRGQVSPVIARAVARALSKSAADRPQTMSNLMSELAPTSPSAGSRTPASASSPTLSPSFPSHTTTLGGATGELGPSLHPPVRRRWVVPATTVILLVAAFGGYAWWSRSTNSVVAPAPNADVVAAPAAVVPEPPVAPAPTKPAKVTLQLRSSPNGAEVFRAADGAHVGKTPYSQTLDPVKGEVVYRVKSAGYEDAEVSLSSESDGSTEVQLQRRHKSGAAHAAPKPIAQPASVVPKPKPKSKNAIVDPFVQ